MIVLSNGHSFEYMAASAALAFDGKGWWWEQPLRLFRRLFDPSLFTAVIKTLTLSSRRGNLRWYNPFGCIRILSEGTVNAVGLTNPGVEWWCRKVGPRIDSTKIPIVGSILGEPNELVAMAKMLNNFDLVGIEINASCPNTRDDFLTNTAKVIDSCQTVKSISRFPIILKLSVVHEIEKIVPMVSDIVEAFSINSVPWSIVFPSRKSPFEHLGGGGVSGKIAQPFTWGLVKKLVSLSDIPVIGPSVWEFQDIEQLRKLGAKAISFGAVFLRFPFGIWPTLFVRKDQRKRR